MASSRKGSVGVAHIQGYITADPRNPPKNRGDVGGRRLLRDARFPAEACHRQRQRVSIFESPLPCLLHELSHIHNPLRLYNFEADWCPVRSMTIRSGVPPACGLPWLVTVAAGLCLSTFAQDGGRAARRGYYRFPAIHGDTLVFTA